MWLDSLSKADTLFDAYDGYLGYNHDGIYRIIYRDSINGYHVKGILHHLKNIYDEPCEALLFFSNQKREFTIVHPYFVITPQQLDKIMSDFRGDIRQNFFTINRKELGFYLDYTIDKTDTTFLKQNVPFFFQDVDFDGEEELVLRFPNKGQRFANLYQVWDREWGEYLRLKYYDPYNKLDDLTRFDTHRKEMTIVSYNGAFDWTEKHYRLKGGAMTFYKLVKSEFYADTVYNTKTKISIYERRGEELILVNTKKAE